MSASHPLSLNRASTVVYFANLLQFLEIAKENIIDFLLFINFMLPLLRLKLYEESVSGGNSSFL